MTFGTGGKEKKQWFVRLPRGVDEYPWGDGGEEGDEYGRSVKSESYTRLLNLSCSCFNLVHWLKCDGSRPHIEGGMQGEARGMESLAD